MTKRKRKLYCSLTFFLDTNLLGIFLGFVSGFGINIITANGNNKQHYISVLCCLVCLIALVILIRIRQTIEQSLISYSKQNAEPMDKWYSAAGPDNFGRRVLFFISFFMIFISFGWAVYFYASGNRISDIEESKVREAVFKRLKNLDSLERSSNKTLININVLLDSFVHERK